jgi:hypothetical protein
MKLNSFFFFIYFSFLYFRSHYVGDASNGNGFCELRDCSNKKPNSTSTRVCGADGVQKEQRIIYMDMYECVSDEVNGSCGIWCGNTGHYEANSKDACVEKSCDERIVNSSAGSGRVCRGGNCYAQEWGDEDRCNTTCPILRYLFLLLFFFFF